MKKFAAYILILSMLTSSVMACSNNNRRDDPERDGATNEEDGGRRRDRDNIIRPSMQLEARHDFSYVDERYTFDTFTAEAPETPWVLENNVPFTTAAAIPTYYSLYLYNGYTYSEIDADVQSNVATITRPIVRHYPAEQAGYTIYEVSYVETFPHRAIIPAGASCNMMWRYHGVAYLDYYTGTTYPYINMNTTTDSFCVSGTILFNGEEYEVYYYSYRENNVISDDTETDENGNTIWSTTYVETLTDYFIVPDGYDGLVMYVYTADDSDFSFEDALAENSPEYTAPEIFSENFDDYSFISIAELG
ncbi:MAG: hypothetical protein MJ103_02825 [Saccharofermentans sp.]|nr:hypothetical protein [Saccharofermentans sp.]